MAKKLTHEEFVDKVNLINPNIIVLDNYINMKTRIRFQCSFDGHIWYEKPENIVRGSNCPKCSGAIKSTEDFIIKLNKVRDDVRVLGEYSGANIKIKCLCLKHNVLFYMSPYHLLNGQGCHECKSEKLSLSKALSFDEFLNKFNKLNSHMNVIGDYNGMHDKIYLQCKNCGEKFYINAHNSINRKINCKFCTLKDGLSNGEIEIIKFLNYNNIKYFYGYEFDDLYGINGGHLSYDFYLPNYNLLIEFQGEQHEKPIEYFGGKIKFKCQQEHDRRKRNYALDNNIELLEIWYWDLVNIENILSDKLNSR